MYHYVSPTPKSGESRSDARRAAELAGDDGSSSCRAGGWRRVVDARDVIAGRPAPRRRAYSRTEGHDDDRRSVKRNASRRQFATVVAA